jgi:Ca-activated chloride channel family protein
MRVLALIAVLGGVSVAAQQSGTGAQLTIAVDVDLVVFNVTVTDQKGRPMSGLTSGDFVLSEDGRPQAITQFSADDVPASVGLVVDNSGSMVDKRSEVVTAALAFMEASHPNDELFVVNFNERASLGLPASSRFTSDARQLRSALLPVPAGLTALYDAVALGLEHLSAGTHDRKALVVLSDGGDNASRRRLDDVLESARRSSATIYTIGVYDETNRDRNPRVLRQIAAVTGGRAYFPRTLTDLSQVWRDIAGGIRSQYTLGYQSSNSTRDGTFRKVTVVVRRNGGRALRVVTRDGYVAPASKAIAK